MPADPTGRAIYFEFITLGRQVRCTAICSVTGVEVSVLGPLNAAQRDLETIAARKLEARLATERTPAATRPSGGQGGSGGSRLV